MNTRTQSPSAGDRSGWEELAGPAPIPDVDRIVGALRSRRSRRRAVTIGGVASAGVVIALVIGLVLVTIPQPEAAATELSIAAGRIVDAGSTRASFDAEASSGPFGALSISGAGVISFEDETLAMILDASFLSDDAELVIVDDTAYVKTARIGPFDVPDGKSWVSSSQSPGSFNYGPDDAIRVLRDLQSRDDVRVTAAGATDIDGTAVDRYDFSGTGTQGETAEGSAFVDGDGNLRRLSFDATGGNGSVRVTVDFSEFGVDVDVVAPPADQVVSWKDL